LKGCVIVALQGCVIVDLQGCVINFVLKHGKKRSSGGSTVSSADDGCWMSTVICRSNGRYLIRAPSSGRYFL
jgi:hypothetical protein